MGNPLEILKQGMSTELWGIRFYEQAVERTASEEGKKVFQSLVAEEHKHLDVLRGQYAAVSSDAKWISVDEARGMASSAKPTGVFPEADMAERLIPEDATDIDALQMAMDFERKGYKLYDRVIRPAMVIVGNGEEEEERKEE